MLENDIPLPNYCIGCQSKHVLFFTLLFWGWSAVQTIAFDAWVWLSSGILLWGSGNIFPWSKHFDIRMLGPMFYLKLCNHIYIYMYIYTYVCMCIVLKNCIRRVIYIYMCILSHNIFCLSLSLSLSFPLSLSLFLYIYI